MTRLYLIGGLTAALVAAWGLSLRYAYTSGHDAATAAQKAADAEAFRDIIKEYNDATDTPISDAATDCLLRRHAGIRTDEDCGAL